MGRGAGPGLSKEVFVKLYRLRDGKEHFVRNENTNKLRPCTPGEQILLTDEQAEAFKDKFVLIGSEDSGMVPPNPTAKEEDEPRVKSSKKSKK